MFQVIWIGLSPNGHWYVRCACGLEWSTSKHHDLELIDIMTTHGFGCE